MFAAQTTILPMNILFSTYQFNKIGNKIAIPFAVSEYWRLIHIQSEASYIYWDGNMIEVKQPGAYLVPKGVYMGVISQDVCKINSYEFSPIPGAISSILQFYLSCCKPNSVLSFDSIIHLELYAKIDMLNRYFENPYRAKQSLQASEYFMSALSLFQDLFLKEILPPTMTIADKQRLNSFLSLVENYFDVQHDVAFYADIMNEPYNNIEDATIKIFNVNPEAIIQIRAIRQSVRLILSQKKSMTSVAQQLNYNLIEWKQLFKKINGLQPDKYLFKCSPELIKSAYALA